MPATMRSPISGWRRISSHSSSVSAPGLRRIASLMPILPMSCSSAADLDVGQALGRQAELLGDEQRHLHDGVGVLLRVAVAGLERRQQRAHVRLVERHAVALGRSSSSRCSSSPMIRARPAMKRRSRSRSDGSRWWLTQQNVPYVEPSGSGTGTPTYEPIRERRVPSRSATRSSSGGVGDQAVELAGEQLAAVACRRARGPSPTTAPNDVCVAGDVDVLLHAGARVGDERHLHVQRVARELDRVVDDREDEGSAEASVADIDEAARAGTAPQDGALKQRPPARAKPRRSSAAAAARPAQATRSPSGAPARRTAPRAPPASRTLQDDQRRVVALRAVLERLERLVDAPRRRAVGTAGPGRQQVEQPLLAEALLRADGVEHPVRVEHDASPARSEVASSAPTSASRRRRPAAPAARAPRGRPSRRSTGSGWPQDTVASASAPASSRSSMRAARRCTSDSSACSRSVRLSWAAAASGSPVSCADGAHREAREPGQRGGARALARPRRR